MTLRLPRLSANLSIVNTENGRAVKEFTRYWNEFAGQIEVAVNGLADNVAAIAAAQATANTAQTTAETAQATAVTAQATAESASGATNTVAARTNLANSYVTELTLTGHDAGSDADIVISDHTRIYGDGTTVSVTGDTMSHESYLTEYWIYYDDPGRVGGAVIYMLANTYADAFVSGTNPNRHFVGAITTPASGAGDTTGRPARPPAYTDP